MIKRLFVVITIASAWSILNGWGVEFMHTILDPLSRLP